MIIILVFIFVLIYIFNYNKKVNEPFNFINQYGKFCSPKSCDTKTYNQCLDCATCGIAYYNNKFHCMSGDLHGPYNINKKIKYKWIHGDDFSRQYNKINGPFVH